MRQSAASFYQYKFCYLKLPKFVLFVVFFFIIAYYDECLGDESEEAPLRSTEPALAQTLDNKDIDHAFNMGSSNSVTILQSDDGTVQYEDSDIAPFDGMARYALLVLQNAGHAKGVLRRISSSRQEEMKQTRVFQSSGKDVEIQKVVILSVHESVFTIKSTWQERSFEYEVILHYSKKLYSWPNIAILQAWKLDQDGQRVEQIEIGLPNPPTWWEQTGQKAFMGLCAAIFCSAIVRFARIGIQRFFAKRKLEKEQKENANLKAEEKSVPHAAKKLEKSRSKQD